jgi:hypothetical protein
LDSNHQSSSSPALACVWFLREEIARAEAAAS